MNFPKPGPAELVRATQKDSDFIKKLDHDLNDLFQRILGQKVWLEWRKYIENLSPIIYLSLTNLSGFQTLGEEYTGILQTDSTHRRIPGKMSLLSMILLYTFGKQIFDKMMEALKTKLTETEQINSQELEHEQDLSTSFNLVKWISNSIEIVQKNISIFTQFHLVLFYFQRKFYHISKRFTGIQYIFVRKFYANQNPEARQNLKYLAWMSIINLVLTILHHSASFVAASRKSTEQNDSIIQDNNSDEAEIVTNGEEGNPLSSIKKCSLCLETRRNPSVTPCGHLFCWNCILDWLRTKQECPICREGFTPSRVVPLQNAL